MRKVSARKVLAFLLTGPLRFSNSTFNMNCMCTHTQTAQEAEDRVWSRFVSRVSHVVDACWPVVHLAG